MSPPAARPGNKRNQGLARAAAEADMAGYSLSDAAVRAMARHEWPGNLRELQHVAKVAVAVSESPLIDLPSLPRPLGDLGKSVAPRPMADKRLHRSTDRDAVSETLARTGWNVSAAAALMGISRATLHRRLNDFQLTRPGDLSRPADGRLRTATGHGASPPEP